MKISVVSRTPGPLTHLISAGEAQNFTISEMDGVENLTRDREPASLVLMDGLGDDPTELSSLEAFTSKNPQTGVILLSSNSSTDFLLKAMRAGVREVLPYPLDPAALHEAIRRLGAKIQSPGGQQKTQVLAFLPCKGGSGATFLATNLGWMLAERASVLLIDLNLQFGNALSFVHDATPTVDIAEVAKDVARIDSTLITSSAVKIRPGFDLLAAPADPIKAVDIPAAVIDRIISAASGTYDFVLLDVSRDLSALTVKALDRAHRIYPVFEAGLPHVRNAAKLLDVFRSLGYDDAKVELVLNRYEKGHEIDLEQIKRTLGGRTIRLVPNAWREVAQAINHGVPIAGNGRRSSVTRVLVDFAESLRPTAQSQRTFLSRLFKGA